MPPPPLVSDPIPHVPSASARRPSPPGLVSAIVHAGLSNHSYSHSSHSPSSRSHTHSSRSPHDCRHSYQSLGRHARSARGHSHSVFLHDAARAHRLLHVPSDTPPPPAAARTSLPSRLSSTRRRLQRRRTSSRSLDSYASTWRTRLRRLRPQERGRPFLRSTPDSHWRPIQGIRGPRIWFD